MKVNILGTEYTVTLAKEEERPKLKQADGYMDFSVKEIVVGIFDADENTVEDLDEYTRKVMRHEIVHAFLYESGMWDNSNPVEAWGVDETITDWIAIQLPKIIKACQECNCL